MMLLLQWPALLLSIIGAWLIAGRSPRQRQAGFWLLLIASVFWAGWGTAASAPAIVLAQLVFAYTSVRGIISNWSPSDDLFLPPGALTNAVAFNDAEIHRRPDAQELRRRLGGHQPLPHPDYPPGTLPPPPRGGSGKTR